MRGALTRALVDGLGERGSISLPLIEQLLITLPIGDLPAIGQPAGIPLVAYSGNVGGTAAQRNGIQFFCPAGYVLRIDRVWSDTAVNLSWGLVLPGVVANNYYSIADGRRAGQVKGFLTSSAIEGDWQTGVSGLVQIARVNDYQVWTGPIYITSKHTLAAWHIADNLVSRISFYGEMFEVG